MTVCEQPLLAVRGCWDFPFIVHTLLIPADRGGAVEELVTLLCAKVTPQGMDWVREQAEAIAVATGRCSVEMLVHLLCRQLSATLIAQTSQQLEDWCRQHGHAIL
jgi:hypothetical protein